jgi:phosphate:Na+ symporter
MGSEPNYLFLSLQLLGALGLLIYGMRMMSEALQKMAGP